MTKKMQAALRTRYGSLDQLELQTTGVPVPGKGEVLVRVKAVSLNTSDVEHMTGRPLYARVFGLTKPRIHILGTDLTGVVEQVGPGVTELAVGDEVVGDILGHSGCLAEFACAPAKTLLKKPSWMSFEIAATLPQAGTIAMQGIELVGAAGPNTSVVINGSGGGSGSLGIQIAKHLGARVTAVDNETKLDFMRRLGADTVVDYRAEDFVARGERHDLILDLASFRPVLEMKRALSDRGKYLLVGGSMSNLLWTLCLGRLAASRGQQIRVLMVQPQQGLAKLFEYVQLGIVTPQIEQIYPLRDAREALRRVAEGRALGKVVVTP
jgi:NADPH:quinone reductase-like Zn-dependent oxidoreductase